VDYKKRNGQESSSFLAVFERYLFLCITATWTLTLLIFKGAYSCVAENLAMMEMRTILANFVSAYDFELSSRTDKARFENTATENYCMVFGSLWIRAKARKQ
jgi:hypothetical protein